MQLSFFVPECAITSALMDTQTYNADPYVRKCYKFPRLALSLFIAGCSRSALWADGLFTGVQRLFTGPKRQLWRVDGGSDGGWLIVRDFYSTQTDHFYFLVSNWNRNTLQNVFNETHISLWFVSMLYAKVYVPFILFYFFVEGVCLYQWQCTY